MEIEHVAGIGFAARRAAQQQRHLAIGDGLLGEVVIGDHGVHAVVAEVFAHGAAGERRQVLQRGRLGGGGCDDDRIFEGAVLFQNLDELGNGRALLADGHVNAVELGLLVAAGVDRLLIEDGVENDRGLAGLAVADDQLALAAADGDQGVHRLEAGRHRLVHRLARQNAGRLKSPVRDDVLSGGVRRPSADAGCAGRSDGAGAGGAGAVGHAAIQLARWAGARVIATVSGDEKAELARAAGADHIVNYRTPSAADEILRIAPDGVDVVVEVPRGRTPRLTPPCWRRRHRHLLCH